MLFRWQGPLERLRGRAPGAPTLLKPEHSAFLSAIISFMLPGEVYLNKAFCALKSKFENHCCLNLQIRKTVLSEGHAPSQKHLSPIAPPHLLLTLPCRDLLPIDLLQYLSLGHSRCCFILFGDKIFHREPAEYTGKVNSLAKKKRSALICNFMFYMICELSIFNGNSKEGSDEGLYYEGHNLL